MKTTEQELTVLRSLADTGQGSVLIGYLQKIINHEVDVRNMAEVNTEEIKARKLFADKVEEHLINKIKVLSGQKISDNDNEYN